MGGSSPMWVPGEAEGEDPGLLAFLRAGATGLYGDLPPGMGPLLQLSAGLTARAFAAFAAGDWETCDALVAEGCAACGEVFAMLTRHIAGRSRPYRVDSPFWEPFLARLAVRVLVPPAAAPPADPVPHWRRVESEADFLVRLRQIRLDAEAEMETRKNAG